MLCREGTNETPVSNNLLEFTVLTVPLGFQNSILQGEFPLACVPIQLLKQDLFQWVHGKN